jgi:NDP-sugar pyrophosphorylase family protein
MSRAVVLAGGRGTRLLPYTSVIPKPLMPIGDRAILEIVLAQLARAGFERATISTGYRGGLIQAVLGDGAAFGIAVDYVRESEPLGTAGALGLIDDLDEPLLVMNGDVLTDLDYAELLARHVAGGAQLTIATTVKSVQVSLGVLEFADARAPERLTAYVEKPQLSFAASMGVYAMSPSVLACIDRRRPLDFPELVTRLLRAGAPVHGWHRPEAYWLDIGRHEDYETAVADFERMRHRLLPAEDRSAVAS